MLSASTRPPRSPAPSTRAGPPSPRRRAPCRSRRACPRGTARAPRAPCAARPRCARLAASPRRARPRPRVLGGTARGVEAQAPGRGRRLTGGRPATSRRRGRSQRAAAIASSDSGFSSDERSPGSVPSAFARTARRTIFAERVFGSASTKKIRSGLNAFPSSAATRAATSAASSPSARPGAGSRRSTPSRPSPRAARRSRPPRAPPDARPLRTRARPARRACPRC